MTVLGLFRIVLTASLWGSIVGILICLLRCILRHKLSAKAQFWLWAVLVFKLFFPFGPRSGFSLFNLFQETKLVESGITVQMHQLTADASNAVQEISYRNFLSAAAWVWLTGALCLGLWFVLSAWILRNKIKGYPLCTQERIVYQLQSARDQLDIRREVLLKIRDDVASPCLYGLFHPMILLPQNIDTLSDQELEYVFLHELAHLKRRDTFTNLALTVLQVVHWFNPLVWYFFYKIRQDMELATDEKAMTGMEKSGALSYGKTLLTAVERFSLCNPAGGTISMAASRSNMRRRIHRICKFKRPSLAWTVTAALIITITSLTCLTDARQTPLLSVSAPLPTARVSGYHPGRSEASASETEEQKTSEIDVDSIQASSAPAATSALHTNLETASDSIPEQAAAAESQVSHAALIPEPTQAPSTAPTSTGTENIDSADVHRVIVVDPPDDASAQAVDSASSIQKETPNADRSMLLPGTNFEDMAEKLQSEADTAAVAYTPDGTTLSAAADDTGCVNLYFQTDTADRVDLDLIYEGAVVAQLKIRPYTYYSYTVSGLVPGRIYDMKVQSEGSGRMLVY